MDRFKKYFSTAAFAGLLFLGTAQLSFGAPSFENGQLTSLSNIPSTDTGNGGGLTTAAFGGNGAGAYTGDTLTGWSNSSYAFLFRSPNLGGTVITGSGGNFSLWTTSNGGPTAITAPPGGGNFIADDGAYETGPITQVITGLTSGTKYNVSFEWAGAQQFGSQYTSATTDSWSVGLGNTSDIKYTPSDFVNGSGYEAGTLTGTGTIPSASVQTTTNLNNVKHGFTGWQSTTFTFTANATTDTLYFFANGTPTGQPPFALLADINVAVPEPKTYAFWTLVFGLLILISRRTWRRKQNIPPANP